MPSKRPSLSITDAQLGLATDDLETFRRHHRLANGLPPVGTSSQSMGSGQRGVLLDPSSLRVMAGHFDRVVNAIQQRLDTLQRETQIASQRQASQARVSVQAANAEIARMRSILRQIDELETEFDKIRRIRDIVRSFRAHVERLERRLAS